MKSKTDEPVRREGDILGISDAQGPKIPTGRQKRRRADHPEGIEIGTGATGIDDVPQRTGATGIDMGGGGEGTDLARHPSRPKSTDTEDE